MKLRIRGNSIRLRLTQTEVQRIGEGETVQEQIDFAFPLVYALVPSDEVADLAADYEDHILQVKVPSALAHAWAVTDQVGMEATMSLREGANLYVLVEKDFQCLHRDGDEAEQDNFPNPAAAEQQ